MKTNANGTANLELSTHAADFAERVRVNQAKLTSELRPHYDFIVCGSGSSGSVVARRLAENPDVSVLLLEAGGSDDVPSVMEAGQWPANLGSDRDWAFQAQPNPHLNGRSIPMNMGKVLGGGSSINAMVWARGHKNDWDYFASEAGDPAWSYESGRTFRTIQVLAASGSTKNRFRHAPALSLFSGKAIRISTRQTYRHARPKYRLPPPKC
jgi:choline dehydrogenase-like flavoprotein